MSERLEEAKTNIRWHWDKVHPEVQEVLDYFIEQTERVEELEGREQKLIEINQHELKYRAEVETQNIELEQQNKRYREAREIIEQIYKDNYVRNAYGYEDGYLDGLDTAMNAIDEALEGESDE